MADQTPTWIHRLRGRFVVLDGPDGSGKSTQYERLVGHVQSAGVPVCQVREPGGTAIGEQIRSVLLNTANDQMDLRCEMLLYMASRAQLIAEQIAPARKQGQFVIADRFISSTLAYQGSGGGLSPADILQVGQIAVGSCWPDLVVVFDVDESTAQSRLGGALDRIEQRDAAYHARVRGGYLQQAEEDPERVLVIDATASADDVFAALMAGLENKSEGW